MPETGRKKIFDGYIEGRERVYINHSALQRVWKNNKTLTVSIPLSVVKEYGIHRGDVLSFNIEFLVKIKKEQINKG